MDHKVEEKMLKEFLELIDNNKKYINKHKWIGFTLIILPAIGVGCLLDGGKNVNMLYGLALGITFGFGLLFRTTATQAPFFAKYLEKKRIEERLQELSKK